MGAELDQSTKILKKIGSGMMQDRIFLVCIGIIVILIIASAIVGAVTGDEDGSTVPESAATTVIDQTL